MSARNRKFRRFLCRTCLGHNSARCSCIAAAVVMAAAVVVVLVLVSEMVAAWRRTVQNCYKSAPGRTGRTGRRSYLTRTSCQCNSVYKRICRFGTIPHYWGNYLLYILLVHIQWERRRRYMVPADCRQVGNFVLSSRCNCQGCSDRGYT